MQHGIKKNSHSTTHRGLEQYLDEISYLFGSKDGESMLIEAGVHTYNFSCFLPLDLPCSVIANNGSVRYIVEAYLHVTNEVDGKMDREFTICRKDDLNLYQDLKMPCEKEDMACFCCRLFSCQPLLLEASIPYSGYIPGDTINVAIKVINKSNATVPKCQIELVQKIKYTR